MHPQKSKKKTHWITKVFEPKTSVLHMLPVLKGSVSMLLLNQRYRSP